MALTCRTSRHWLAVAATGAILALASAGSAPAQEATDANDQAEAQAEGQPEVSPSLPAPGPDVPESAKASLVALGFEPMTIPVIDGSTSTQPLAMLLGATAVDVPVQWQRSNHLRMLRPVDEGPQNNPMFGRVQLRQTHGSYVALIEGKSDLILVAREPSESEKALMVEQGVDLDVRPVALDALIFIVNNQNPVDAMTLEQVRAVYRGEIESWSDLGGADMPIRPIIRPRDSGSQELMAKLVLKGDTMAPRMAVLSQGMRLVIAATRVDPQALGYTIYYYQRFMMPEPAHLLEVPEGLHGPHWKPLAINGVTPMPETIGDRSYPLTEPVYVVVRKGDDADAPAVRLRDWLLSREGQQLVAASGYVPYQARQGE